jgi:LacI family transcriptional regulator
MKSLLEDNKVTAVFTTNYEMTLGAIIALNECDIKIPEQISFVGFDNMQISQVVQPKLTVISQPLKEIGENAAFLLLKLLENGANGTPQNIILTTEVIVGKSILVLD